jgi:hypothetical protein
MLRNWRPYELGHTNSYRGRDNSYEWPDNISDSHDRIHDRPSGIGISDS